MFIICFSETLDRILIFFYIATIKSIVLPIQISHAQLGIASIKVIILIGIQYHHLVINHSRIWLVK